MTRATSDRGAINGLAGQVLGVIESSERPLRAQEIAARLTRVTGQAVDTSAVNSVLYGELRGHVQQDKRYAWTVRASGTARASSTSSDQTVHLRSSPEWERFRRLVAYYLDCVREDAASGARHFLTDDGERFITLALDREWSARESRQHTEALDGRWGFAKLLRQSRGQGALFYGYPLFVDWVERSRRGWSGGFAIPVFLQPVEYELHGDALELSLSPEWPRVNPAFLERAFSSAEERRHFVDELGLLHTEGDPPDEGLTDVVRRLKQIGAPIPMLEELDPSQLDTSVPTRELDGAGLRNRAVLVMGERSKYTAGLERELEQLAQRTPDEQLASSALATLFVQDSAPQEHRAPAPPELVEVVPINDEQREACRSAFVNPITVVTGPPGTGKSQVVITTLANAYLRRERVLFTSRNNKAVDVVEQRLNALSGFPLVVRAGSRAGDRDLRVELAQFLASVLSFRASEAERAEVISLRADLEAANAERDRVLEQLEALRNARNDADRLDAEFESLVAELGAARSAAIEHVDDAVDLSVVDRLDERLQVFTQSRSPFGRLARWLRWNAHARELHAVASDAHELGLADAPPEPPPRGSRDLSTWEAFLTDAQARARAIAVRARLRTARRHLSSLGTTAELATQYAAAEERVWDIAAQLIAVTSQLLPDRLTAEMRRAIGEYRATLERLTNDQIGGAAYAKLRTEQERLFERVSAALPVWCVTNLSARGALPFESGIFDLVVIDEASQCDIPSALPLLFRAKRVMVIGDPNQLSHISTLDRAREQQLQMRHGLDSAADQPFTFSENSLFDLTTTHATGDRVVTLYEHFRSHRDIVEYSNRTWYRGKLRIATDYRRLRGPSGPAVRWTHVRGAASRPASGGALNAVEAEHVVAELRALLTDRGFRGSVGIVSPFRAQVNRIRDLVARELDLSDIERCDLIVDTAHGFQGDERDLMLFSPVVASDLPRGARYFLASTGNLFNVAITRARAVLHVVGDLDACAASGIPHIEAFAAYVTGLGDDEPSPGRADVRIGPWERPLQEALASVGLAPVPQYPVHQYRIDLAFPNATPPLAIEVDGELFHREWDGSRSREDLIRDMRLAALGWKVKRFWVYEVRDELERCVEEVRELLQVGRS